MPSTSTSTSWPEAVTEQRWPVCAGVTWQTVRWQAWWGQQSWRDHQTFLPLIRPRKAHFNCPTVQWANTVYFSCPTVQWANTVYFNCPTVQWANTVYFSCPTVQWANTVYFSCPTVQWANTVYFSCPTVQWANTVYFSCPTVQWAHTVYFSCPTVQWAHTVYFSCPTVQWAHTVYFSCPTVQWAHTVYFSCPTVQWEHTVYLNSETVRCRFIKQPLILLFYSDWRQTNASRAMESREQSLPPALKWRNKMAAYFWPNTGYTKFIGHSISQSPGAVWKSRWPSLTVLMVSVYVK